MMLCTNRFEGFGPHSKIHPSLPTECFLDTVVVPLPTWLYMTAIPILLFIFRRSHSRGPSGKPGSYGPTSRTRFQTFLQVLYLLLAFAMIAMISLEIARLSVAQLGIGLLPFSYVGVLLAVGVHFLSRNSAKDSAYASAGVANWVLRCFSAIFWILLLIAMAIKAAAAKTEENDGFVRTGVQAKYPVDDSYVDNLTMACVEGVLALLELVTL